MKIIYKTFSVVFITVMVMSCNKFLERDIVTDLKKDQLIHTYSYTRDLLTGIYVDLPNGFDEIDGAMMAAATDEAEHAIQGSDVQKFNLGSWNEYDNPDNVWYKYYRAIQKANQFLIYADSVNLDEYRLNPAADQQAIYLSRLADIKRWKYEARFLRAFFYFELVKRYGGVPLVTTEFDINSDYAKIGRSSLADCIKFITDECDSATNELPVTYAATDLGRVTKGAALALKSKVLLYAASDLFNNTSWAGGYAHAELISLPNANRNDNWKKAADAAKAVIDLTAAGYALHTSYAPLFKTFDSKEIILARRNGATNNFEKMNYSIGYDLGNSGTGPSQDLVDAYEVKVSATESQPFDWNNATHAANPYANRDPRLQFSILTNNFNFKGRPLEIWAGGKDGTDKRGATRTGYYLNKYIDESLDLLNGRTSVHTWILIRLAEIYLNYAEALNEYSPGHPDIKTYVDMVRQRPTVAMPVLPSGLTQGQMRERIRNERRVELAFEGQRYWDVKRWMQGPQYFNVPLRGVRITKKADNDFSYNVVQVEQRAFLSKMYFYPIPQSELNRAKALVQNPGW